MTNRLRLTAMTFACLLAPFAVFAQQDEVQARVDIGIQQGQAFWAGQQITVNLDLKTTGFSFSDSHFNLPEVSGGFLMQTDTTTIKLNENVKGQSWQILRYPLAFYPHKSGQLEIPPIDVRFTTSAGFGSVEKAFEFQTEALALEIKLPPGVTEGALLITTSAFELDHDWQPLTTSARTGDAFTLNVTRRADDVSAMLLPPLPVFRTDGLAAYPQPPEVNDKTNRGDLTGERKDSIIWVVEKPGTYEIPGIRFQWWDPSSQELKQQIVPGLNLAVMAPPADAVQADTAAGTTGESPRVRRTILSTLALILAAILWWRFAHNAHKKAPDNEKTTFGALQSACKSNQASQTYAALYAWLECTAAPSSVARKPTTLNALTLAWSDQKLATELDELQKAVASRDDTWTGKALADSLRRLRRKIGRTEVSRSKICLKPLNP
ncbi:MAG: hypothetical protein OQJ84_01360 [Xanthomonadales bacterium]|nr:hypothetical protein [Xanthomonadales bacterium]